MNNFTRELRESGLTMQALSTKSGIPLPTLAVYAGGQKIPSSHVNKLGMALGCPNTYLTDGRPQSPLRPETLRSCRERAGLSVEELSELSGVGKSTIYNIEAGKVTNPASLPKLAAALDMPAATAETPAPKPKKKHPRPDPPAVPESVPLPAALAPVPEPDRYVTALEEEIKFLRELIKALIHQHNPS